MSVYTPTQTHTLPHPFHGLPWGQLLSPVPFSLQPIAKAEPVSEIIVPQTKITVPIGQENALFRQTCETLDRALHEWNTTVPDIDKDKNPKSETIILNIPNYVSEKLVYGKRVGKDKYWEGGIELWPSDTRVMKLRLPYGEIVLGVWIGIIDDFWGNPEGVSVFYGMDKKMYVQPGGCWGDIEGEWEIFEVEGGWDMRSFTSDNEIDDLAFAPVRN
jgi:hypothetical protein